MPIRIVRQVTFLVSMILLAFAVAGGLALFITYKEGGIFDGNFRQKMELAEFQLDRDEVMEGLPSVTAFMVPDAHTVGETSPEVVLHEAGRNISSSSKQENSSSSIVNVDFRTLPGSETAEIETHFRFNASTAVDYNDDVYENTVRMFSNLIKTEDYSSVSVESTPTPDGGRSLTVETTIKNTTNDNSPLELSNAWKNMVRPIGSFIGDDGNLSSAKLTSRNVSVSADFYDRDTYDEALEMELNIFDMIDVVANSSAADYLLEGNYNLSAVSSSDSALTILFDETIADDSFSRLSNALLETLKRHGYESVPWTVLMVVEDNPELSSIVFGTA